MPYKSKAQQAKFHADPRLAALASEYDAATKRAPGGFAALPQRVKPKLKPKKSARRPKAARSRQGARMGALEKMLGAVRAARR